MRKLIYLAGMFILVILLTACNEEMQSGEEIVEKQEEGTQIGITFDSYVIERWERDRDIFVSRANELGAKVNVQNANGDIKKQKEQISYFIKKKMDVIVIIATDSGGLKTKIKEAKEAGIPVIAYDRLIKEANVDLYISFDNVEVGRLMGEQVRDALLDGGDVVLLQGPTTDHNVEMIYEGIQEAFCNSKIAVVGCMNAKKWKAEEAFDFLESYLKTNHVPDGVICGNDNLAGQAVKALSVKRKAGKVVVTGQDADLEACQRIMEGTQDMTVYKPIEKLAKKAAECAVALARGQEIRDTEQIYDGRFQIPYVTIKPSAVTRKNMDEVIVQGGFHLEEEIYRTES